MSAASGVQEMPAVDLGGLLDAGDGAVVTLTAGETRLAAHRAVLAARSPVFAAMFQHGTLEAGTDHVSIADVEGPVLRQLLAYCYTLQAPQLPDMAPQLLAAADKYGLSALKDVCEQELAARLSTENAAAAALLAVRHSCPSLTVAAIDFIRAHFVRVVGTQGWADAVLNQPRDVVEVSRLLSQSPQETRKPATANPGPHHQHHSSHGRRTPAAAATPTTPCDTLPPDDRAISRVQNLSAQERSSRLMKAAQQGAVQELRVLLAVGADVAERDGSGLTALHCAAINGHDEVARCLLEGGAEVDSRSSEQDTPLHWAAGRGHAAVVRVLLAASADPNARNCRGSTPLHHAARNGYTWVAADLLEWGADKEAMNGEEKTALDMARDLNYQQLIQILSSGQISS